MEPIISGIYENPVSEELSKTLLEMDKKQVHYEKLDPEETPHVLTEYFSHILESCLRSLILKNKRSLSLKRQIDFVNDLLREVKVKFGNLEGIEIVNNDELLKAILLDDSLDNVTKTDAKELIRPESSIAATSLFTNSPTEPSLVTELNKEIASSDRIDLLVSFIRNSGVNKLLKELELFTQKGKRLRIITTTYMGATQNTAIERLSKLENTEIKISFDPNGTKLHAKAYIFYRNNGFSTAYVGSSNLTKSAMESGCEWNAKFTKYDSPNIFEKIASTFEVYWKSTEYELYSESQKDRLKKALSFQKESNDDISQKIHFYLDVEPYRYQEEVLDALNTARTVHESYRNLVSAATGTGKTVVAAFDYKRQVEQLGRKPRLLYIAHRKEILEQSLACFRMVLRDNEFADLFVGGEVPSQAEFLFVSVDMINSRNLTKKIANDYYEYIVIDECHHIAAKTYLNIINHFRPKILLGLTATPDRMDGEDILQYFDNRVAAHISLADAIDRKLLCPFQYFGVSDCVDYSSIKWARHGYDVNELDNVLVFSEELARKRAELVVESIIRYAPDLDEIKALVFCVSIEHAKFMASELNKAGITSEYLTGKSSSGERNAIRSNLETGKTKCVCVVDIYNEGVDIKSINTVLFLRPTDSATIFLQQLGRGLRLSDNKDCLTVLDFIGKSNRHFNYETKFRTLLGPSSQGTKREVENDFPHLPKGCFIQLDKVSKSVVLESIKTSVTEKAGIIEHMRSFVEDTGMKLNIEHFFDYYHITPRAFYDNHYKWTFYKAIELAKDNNSVTINQDAEDWKKMYRLSSLDDYDFLSYMLKKGLTPDLNANYSDSELEYWKMLYGTLFDGKPETSSVLLTEIRKYWEGNDRLRAEVKEMFNYLIKTIDFVAERVDLPYSSSLKVHCTYTRRQALAALDEWNTSSEGVARVAERKTTCLFITLNKSNSFYSPTTSYNDYSIDDHLFHWQSQNATADYTPVGKRYINHKKMKESVLLFVRERKEDQHGAVPFVFLGSANYVSHSDNKPMNIIWNLDSKIPAKFLSMTDRLGVG